MTLQERIRGCLFGGAIGDAMGGPFEGLERPVEYHERFPWAISDDTQLTLATCEGIIQAGQVSPEHIAKQFCHWQRERRITGPGASTLKALRDLEAGAHWALAGAKGEMSAGNGPATRIAPLAFCLNPDNAGDRRTIRDVCRITHHNDESYIGALAILIAIQSTPADDLLLRISERLPDSRVRDRLIEVARLPEGTSVGYVASRFGNSGYVVQSVPLALYASMQIGRLTLPDLLCEVIEAGGDTDSVASMVGQIVGTWIGASEIPESLIAAVPNHEQICKIAIDFLSTIHKTV